MWTSSMLTRQFSGGRGNSGAHKLIPMPLGISCAPALPTEIPPFVNLLFPGAQNQPDRTAAKLSLAAIARVI